MTAVKRNQVGRVVEDRGGWTYHGAAASNLGAQVFPLQPEKEASRSTSSHPDSAKCEGGSVSEELLDP